MRFRMRGFQSGIFRSRDEVNGFHKCLPALALAGQYGAAFGRELVIAPAALAGFFDPKPLDPIALFQAIEERVERRRVKAQRAFGAQVDEFADLVAVPGDGFEKRENEQLSAALLPFGIDNGRFHMWSYHILRRGRGKVRGFFAGLRTATGFWLLDGLAQVVGWPPAPSKPPGWPVKKMPLSRPTR